jgi:battenin
MSVASAPVDGDGDDDNDKPLLSSHLAAYYSRHWLCFATMGLLNNFHYAVVIASAYSLASAFSALPLIGLIQWATVILAITAKLVNGLFFLSTSPYHRVVVSCMVCMMGLTLLSLSVSVRMGFWLVLVTICLVGGYGALCESVVLGYLKHFHPAMVGAWGAGTGGSGVAGTLSFLLLHGVWGLEISAIYIIIAPACLLYIAAFKYIQTTAHVDSQLLPASDAAFSLTTAAVLSTATAEEPTSPLAADTIISSSSPPSSAAAEGATGASRWSHAMFVARQVSSVATQLGLVFFFEYLILVGLASQADPRASGSGWWYDNAYEVLSFCYQAGVLVSRSSLAVVQVPRSRLHWITLLQAVNAAIWLVQAWRGLMPLWLQFAHMVCVGLLGGGMYVNVFFLLRKDSRLRESDRELAINLVTTAYNVGIVGASLVETVLLNTVLTRQR